MLSKNVEKALNEQIEVESNSAYAYLAMASWCESKGLEGCAKFFYKQSDEERTHMLRLFRYINESGGHAITPTNKKPQLQFKDIMDVVQAFLDSEIIVSNAVNKLVYIATQEKDYTSLNFLQWYVEEQHEEETMARNILDKINLIGLSGQGLYYIDKEMGAFATTKVETANTMDAEGGA